MKILCWVKETQPILWYHSYKMSRIEKSTEQQVDQWLLGAVSKVGAQGEQEDREVIAKG